MRPRAQRNVVAVLAALVLLPLPVAAGAPMEEGRFVNPAGPGDRGGIFSVRLPFFARMTWRTLFEEPTGAAERVPYDAEALRHNPSVTWIGHATTLVRIDGVTFLTDPVFSDRASPVSFAGPERVVDPGVPLGALPPVDFVVISHDHYDHTDVESIRRLAERGIPFVVPLRLGDVVRAAGGQAIELDWWETTTLAGVKVHCVPAQHFSGRSLTDRGYRLWAGFVVEGPTTSFYHAGDTGDFDGLGEIGERLGPIDLAALPIGAYEPRAMMGFVHLNPEEAVQAAVDVRAERFVGMHWGTFVLTDEPLGEPPRRFHAEAERRGVEDRAWILKIGETRTWSEDKGP